jgi:RHS repeat-associated protein
MSRRISSRLVAGALIICMVYAPMAGAQTQNTTVNYLFDAMGNRTQVTDLLGNTTNFSYDALNRVKQQVQPVPATGVARPTSNFTYDGLDQIGTISDPRNLTTTYTSDGLANQSGLASPDTGTTNRTYDTAGNLLTSTDARGKVATYTYDALDRVTSISFSSGQPIAFEYDGGSAGAPYALGHLTKMTDESGQTTYAYDQRGRVVSKVQTSANAVSTVTRAVSYAFDTNGRLTSLTYPSGNRINYSYDAAGHVSNLTLNPSDSSGGTNTGTAIVLLDQISYAPFGGVQGWVWGNSTDVTPNAYSRTYDLDGRVTSYPLGNVSNGIGMQRTVSYDAASRIKSMTHTGNATASLYDQSFTYDGLGRLLTFSGSGSNQSYSYDANGNRTLFLSGASNYGNTISATSNRLNTTTGPYPAKSNQYDASGNLSTDGTVNYSFNDRGRMLSSTNGGVTTSYLYNGFGQRVSKSGAYVATGANEYAYDEDGHLLGEYDAAGAVVQETVFLGDMPVVVLKQTASAPPVVVNTSVYYIYSDHINTPRVITDAGSGAVVWNWSAIDPFGFGLPNENPSGSGAFSYNVRFPGQLFDKETNNHYNYFRDYDPSTGRYIQSDPIGLAAGVNTYAYVGNTPVSAYDPDGLQIIIVNTSPPPGAYNSQSGISPGAIATGMDGSDRNRSRGTAAEARSRESSRTSSCPPDQKDPCEEIRKKIRDIEQKLSSKERQMAQNQYDLYNRAYDTNPGGELAGKGTWVGHMAQIDGLRVGLERAKAQARAMGCL